MLEQETMSGSNVEYANEVCANLGQEVKARAQAGKLGYDILINERTKQYGFYLYKGKDLTAKTVRVTRPAFSPVILITSMNRSTPPVLKTAETLFMCRGQLTTTAASL